MVGLPGTATAGDGWTGLWVCGRVCVSVGGCVFLCEGVCEGV